MLIRKKCWGVRALYLFSIYIWPLVYRFFISPFRHLCTQLLLTNMSSAYNVFYFTKISFPNNRILKYNKSPLT